MEFSVDGHPLNTELESPYNCILDTARLTGGAHTLRGVAFDRAGNSTARSISVNVENAGATQSSGPQGLIFNGDFDSGGTSQWFRTQSLDGRVTVGSSSPEPFEGSHRARFEVRPGDREPTTGSNRAEVAEWRSEYLLKGGADVYFRFQVSLASGWPFEGKWNVVWQLHSAGDHSPPVDVEAAGSGGSGYWRVFDAERLQTWWKQPGSIATNRWYDFIVRVRHSRDPSQGFVEVWLDGVPQVMANGTRRQYGATLLDAYNYPKFGYYRDPSHSRPGVLYGDGYVIGSSYSAVSEAY